MGMRIDLSCPAEILRTEMPEKDRPWAELTLMNGTDRGIDSCEATVRLLDGEGKELGRAVHRARALAGRPYGTFRMTVPLEPGPGAATAEARLDKVWFEDHDVWRRNEKTETEYEENTLPPGNDLNALRYVAGNGAVGFPSQQALLWVCVCGRPNGNNETICGRCHRQKEMIFQQYNRNAVLRQVSQRERQLDLKTRSAREEAAQMQRVREEEYNLRQAAKRRRKRLGAALAAAAVLCAALAGAGIPLLRVLSADRAYSESRYEDAEQILLAMNGFPGTAERLERTKRAMARRDGQAALTETPEQLEEEPLSEIAARLREQGGEEGDALLADRVDLKRAELLLFRGDPEGAEALLASLPEETEGLEALKTECIYSRGEAERAARNYEAARSLFLSLGDYREAETLAQACLYEQALEMTEAGDYAGAIACLAEIPDYLDSREQILKNHYLDGMTLENAGETEAARLAYLEAGEYEDAAGRARAIRWSQAESLLADGHYEEALPLYREMDGDGDAREKWILCATELARAAYSRKEYEAAAEILSDLPEDTKDTAAIRTRALFNGAKRRAEQGDLEQAVAMMEKVAGYGNSNKNIRNWRIALAEESMEREEWQQALDWLEPVADNYSAQRLIQQIEKNKADAEAAEETQLLENAEAAEETQLLENAEAAEEHAQGDESTTDAGGRE